METNTIIITSEKVDVTKSSAIQHICAFLNDHILTRYEILQANALQVITLSSFGRLLVIFPSLELAKNAMQIKISSSALSDFQFSYSLVDTDNQAKKQYLELPPHKRLFLVSPPTSPPPGFDYSRLEESPGGAPACVAHACVPDKSVHHIPNSQETRQVLLENSVGTITLDYYGDSGAPDENPGLSVENIRTGMPPRSIFDEDD